MLHVKEEEMIMMAVIIRAFVYQQAMSRRRQAAHHVLAFDFASDAKGEYLTLVKEISI